MESVSERTPAADWFRADVVDAVLVQDLEGIHDAYRAHVIVEGPVVYEYVGAGIGKWLDLRRRPLHVAAKPILIEHPSGYVLLLHVPQGRSGELSADVLLELGLGWKRKDYIAGHGCQNRGIERWTITLRAGGRQKIQPRGDERRQNQPHKKQHAHMRQAHPQSKAGEQDLIESPATTREERRHQ